MSEKLNIDVFQEFQVCSNFPGISLPNFYNKPQKGETTKFAKYRRPAGVPGRSRCDIKICNIEFVDILLGTNYSFGWDECYNTVFCVNFKTSCNSREIRERSDKYLAYKRKTKIFEKWRFIYQRSLLLARYT